MLRTHFKNVKPLFCHLLKNLQNNRPRIFSRRYDFLKCSQFCVLRPKFIPAGNTENLGGMGAVMSREDPPLLKPVLRFRK
jgi:hypothetical protein